MNPVIHPLASPQFTASDSGYRADIDGLRALAILSVILFHAFPGALRSGYCGVDIFFVISGFLISGIVMREQIAHRFTLGHFFSRRIRRIFPALILVLISTLLVGWLILFSDEYRSLGRHVTAGAAFASNFMLWNESGYFDAAAEKKPLLHFWSLAIEEQFYLLWPVLLMLVGPRRWKALIVSLLAASFLTNLILVVRAPVADFYSPASRFWELLVGAALAFFLPGAARLPADPGGPQFSAALRNACAWAGLTMIILALALLHKGSAFPGAWALLPCIGSALLISAGPGASVNRRFLSSRFMVWTGQISYPLYLWHWPILCFMEIGLGASLSRSERFAALGLSFLMAWATTRLVEARVRYRPASGTVALLLALMAGCAGAGLGLVALGGLPSRAINQIAYTDLSWPEQLGATASCKTRYPDAGYCMLAGTRPPDVALMGDSFANAYYPGLAENLAGKGRQLVQLGAGGCPPLLGITSGYQGGEDWCNGVGERLLENVMADPAIRDVILAANWHLYAIGTRLNAQHNQTRPPWRLARRDGPELSNAQAFEQSLRNTLERLLKSGKRVHFMEQTPELQNEVSNPRLAGSSPPHFSVARPVSLAYLDEYRRLSEAILKDYPQMLRIDPVPLFCNAQQCLADAGGTLLYRDALHLSLAGSHFLGRALVLQGLTQ